MIYTTKSSKDDLIDRIFFLSEPYILWGKMRDTRRIDNSGETQDNIRDQEGISVSLAQIIWVKR